MSTHWCPVRSHILGSRQHGVRGEEKEASLFEGLFFFSFSIMGACLTRRERESTVRVQRRSWTS